MARENIVLSLNPDGQRLHRQESVLRANGFEIISASTPLQARFEIEMGRCGIFLTSYITPSAIYLDLANLFRRSCPNGLVIFLTEHPDDNAPDADVLLSSGRGPTRSCHPGDSLHAGNEHSSSAAKMYAIRRIAHPHLRPTWTRRLRMR